MPSAMLPTFEAVGDAELHTLPNGNQVVYRDRDHSYWLSVAPDGNGGSKCSGRLTGVTSVVSPFDWRPDNLMRWAANRNCDGVAALAAEGLSAGDLEDMRACLRWLTSGESITTALEDARLHWTQTRDDRSASGTNAHQYALHALAQGYPVPDFSKFSPEEQGFARGMMAFWHECEPEPHYAEQIVADLDLGVAGRFDLICDLTYRGVRHRALVDAKTTEKGFLPTKHHAQLAGYEHCAQRVGIEPTEIQLILQVFPDGSYVLTPACATADDFLAAVDLYRREARIKRDVNAHRRGSVR